MGIGFTSIGGPVYLAVAVVLNALVPQGRVDIWRRDEAMAEADNYKVEKSVFRSRSPTCSLHFGALAGRGALRISGWGGWAWLMEGKNTNCTGAASAAISAWASCWPASSRWSSG
jgi:protoheme IX farnesyltransferase